jgi:hypothetical protein
MQWTPEKGETRLAPGFLCNSSTRTERYERTDMRASDPAQVTPLGRAGMAWAPLLIRA